ncbi:HAMP domain-containing protein [Halobacterium litoreum]|uniref:histidine kinase n=1 Tax=Halobacterium litoreum TaxID=2039234 RepID=A0ABD5NCC1_9EURY|nr:HAMP domain-containing protein [Halobacterium litoreum]UHH14194.1 HAMP domain-containing protein [Halobacterium litoreum]
MTVRETLRSLPVVRRVVAAVAASYRRKLAAALLVALLVVAAATVGLYFQLGGLLEDNVEQSMTAAANAEADELTEWSSQNRLVARVLSEHPVYETGDADAVRAYLRTQRADRQEADIENAYVVDRRNLTVQTSARRSLEGTPVADLPWEEEFAFRDFDDVRITRPYETATGTTVVGLVTPIRGTPGHLLVVAVDAASVFQRFEHPVDGGFTRVVDSNGTVVFADDRDATLQQYLPQTLRAPSVSRGLHGESGFVADARYERSADDGASYVAAFAPVEGTDWVVVEHAPESEAYAIARRARTWIGLVGVLAFAGLLGVVAVVGADVRGALASLSSRAERIEDGEYDVDFDTDRPDEFGDLNRTLANTRDTLRRRIEEIRETRDELEASNAALEERSAMVSVLNRVLRHNVRNDVNVVAGRVALVAERVEDDELRAELEGVRETALELAAISDRTQRIKQLLAEENANPGPLRVVDALDGALRDVAESRSDASVDVTGDADAVAVAVPTLPGAVADVVEQLVDANDGAVAVDVSVRRERSNPERDAESVVVTIADDADGLPDLDVEVVGEGEETPLNHADGLALWCLEWTVAKSGGDLVVACGDDPIEIRLPAVEGVRDE